MEEVVVIHSRQDIKNCIHFINEYRKLETLSYEKGIELIKLIFSQLPGTAWQIEHITDQWRWKKKDFGSFYLNSDAVNRIAIYNHFGITDERDKIYLEKIAANKRSVLFLSPSYTYRRLNNIIIFFNNHGISEKTTEYLTLKNIPVFNGNSFNEKNPCYGNTKNWGKYILSLSEPEQYTIIETILNNYQTDNYI